MLKLLSSGNYIHICIRYQKLFLIVVIFQYLITDHWFRFPRINLHMTTYTTMVWLEYTWKYFSHDWVWFQTCLLFVNKSKATIIIACKKKFLYHWNFDLILWLVSIPTIKNVWKLWWKNVSSFQKQSNFTFTWNRGNIKKMQMLATYFFNCNKRHFTSKSYVDIRMKI